MLQEKQINFVLVDNPSANKEMFTVQEIYLPDALKAWKDSVFSYEWLNENAKVKSIEMLQPDQQEQFSVIKESIERGEIMPRPVLGIGIMENIEIGAGKALMMTIAALGYTHISAHIPRADIDLFSHILA